MLEPRLVSTSSRSVVFNVFCSIASLQALCLKITPSQIIILVLSEQLFYFENNSMLTKYTRVIQ